MAEDQIWLGDQMWMRTLADLGTVSMDYLEILPDAVRTPVVHDDCDEILYILDGELEMYLDGRSFPVGRGAAVAVPRGTSHGSRNTSGATVRMLAVNSPAFRIEHEREVDEDMPAA